MTMGLDLLHVKLAPKENDTSEYFTLEELNEFPLIVLRHRHLITLEIEEDELIPVIYFKTIRHQRKGMKQEFQQAFHNCICYFLKEDTIRASTYLIEKRTFKEDFIDNFIEGESIFFASW